MSLRIDPINWNAIKDQVDLDVWNKLVQQFWIDTKIPLSNDLKSWSQMSDEEKAVTKKVFVGLTALDTLQGRVGATELMKDAITPHEADVLANIAFMEAMAEGTELLTPNGWIPVSEVDLNTKVAQYNPDTRQITFVYPEIVSSHETPEVFVFSGKKNAHKQVVSGGHRTYYLRKSSKKDPATGNYTYTHTVDQARDLASKGAKTRNVSWVTSGIGVGEGLEFSDLDKVRIALNYLGKASEVGAEGFNTYEISIHHRKRRARFEDILNSVSLPFTKPREDTFLIAFDEELGVDSTDIGWVDLSQVSKNWALDFFEELAYWHTDQNKALVYTSTNESDVDFVSALAVLSDSSTLLYTKEIELENVYCLRVYIGQTISSNEHGSSGTKVEEPTMVYSIQVPSTYLVSRYKGSTPVIAGNCVHAKSYSSIFSTLISSEEIKDIYRWAEENPYLEKKMELVLERYEADDPLKKKIASTLLESFLFYSGFFWPLYLSTRSKLTNTADIIRLILADESVHGFYIGYKYQRGLDALHPEDRERYKDFTYELLYDLYENEVEYTRDIYDNIGLTDDVLTFLRYNANKALSNLGYEPLFPSTDTQVNPSVLSSLTPNGGESHDFFSGSGSSYAIGATEDLKDDDWSDLFDD